MSFPVFSSATVLTLGTLPFTTATILVEDFNFMANTVRDIMGRNPNGYGLDAIFSVPVSTGTKLTSIQWEQLRRDVNVIHGHITSSTTATVAFTTGTLYQTLTLSSLTNSTSSNVLIFNTMSGASLVSGDIIYDSTITIVTVYTNSATIVTSEPITNLSTGKQIQITLNPRNTSRIDAQRTNALNEALHWSSGTRYTCAENEYIADIDTGETINVFNGISTRTIPFGLGTQTEIKHEYTAVFADGDSMRYFFNQGGEFKWFPFYRAPEPGDASLGDIDFLWGNFVNWYLSSKTTSTVVNPSAPEGEFWTYDRETFIAHSSTLTTYSSGTLEMIVQAGIINQGTYTNKGIVMTATLRNTDIGDWTIAPVSGYWNYQV